MKRPGLDWLWRGPALAGLALVFVVCTALDAWLFVRLSRCLSRR